MFYGYLSGDIFPLFVTTLGGVTLSLMYLSVYLWYTAERAKVAKQLAAVTLWNTVIVVLTFSGEEFLGITDLSNAKTGDWVGYIAVATSIVLYASPFATLRHVIRTKTVETIPIEMVVVGTVTNSIWVAYGILNSDNIVAIPNIICVFFGCVQIVVYFGMRRQQRRLAGEADKKDAAGLSAIELDRTSAIITDSIREDPRGSFQPLQSPV